MCARCPQLGLVPGIGFHRGPCSAATGAHLPIVSTSAIAVLIAYASRNGSTQEIAERLATVLRARGYQVDLRSAERVSDVSGYQALVIGSPVYDGSWLPEAAELVRQNLDRLATMPVWLFSVGSFGDEHPVIGRLMKKEPREIARLLAAVRPRDYRVFAGVIVARDWPLYGRLLLRVFGGRAGDNRNWKSIEHWAAQIAAGLPRPVCAVA